MISLGKSFNSYTCSEWVELGASYTIVDDRSTSIWSDFGNGGVPRNAIIDSDGVVKYNSPGFNATAINAVLDELLSTSAIDDHDSQPLSHSLISNYPNPFNAGTRINFEIPEAGMSRLTIHDMTGRKLRTLLHKNVEIGLHAVEWNTLNDQGEALPSGVYIARLESGGLHSSTKLLLLK